MINKKNKLALAFSSGIDSTMSSFILKNNNLYIENIIMKTWFYKNKNFCSFDLDVKYAINISKKLNIKLHLVDYTKSYWSYIFINFIKDLKNGLTPNPDILCNKKIKFKFFLIYIIMVLNFDFLLTGHYSSIVKKINNFKIKDNTDYKKNQNYFLYSIKTDNLKKIIFPLIHYKKINLRYFIKKINFINFNKRSSIGICFIGEKNFLSFIKNYIKEKPGLILNEKNNIIGQHNGLYFYTIGQRKNIKIPSFTAYFVFKKNIKKNYLYITNNDQNLLSKKIKIKHLCLKNKKYIIKYKIRNTSELKTAFLYFCDKQKNYFVYFKKKEKSLTCGQHIVLYNEDFCLGGGIIKKIIN